MPNQFDFCNQWAKSTDGSVPSYQELDQLFEQSKKQLSVTPDGWSVLFEALEKKRLLYLWAKDKSNNLCLVILLGIQKIRDNKLADFVHYEQYIVVRGEKCHCPSFPIIKYKNNQFWFLEADEKSVKKAKLDLIPEKLICGKTGVTFPYAHTTQQELVKSIEKQVKENKTLFSQTILDAGLTFFSSISELFNLEDANKKYYPFLLGLFSDSRIYMRKKYLHELLKINPPKEVVSQLFATGSSECIAGLFLELAGFKNSEFLDTALEYESGSQDWIDDNMAEGLQRCATVYVASVMPERKLEAEKFVAENLPFIQFPLKKKVVLRGRDYPYINAQEHVSYRYYAYIFMYAKDSSVFETSYFAQDALIDSTHIKSFIELISTLDMVDALADVAYAFDTAYTYYPITYNRSPKAFVSLQHQIFRAMDAWAVDKPNLFIQVMERLLLEYNNLAHMDSLLVQGINYQHFIMHFLFYYYEKEITTSDADSVSNALHGEQWHALDQRQDRYPEIWNNHLNTVLNILEQSTNTFVLKGLLLIAKDTVNQAAVLQQPYHYFLKVIEKNDAQLTAFALSCIEKKIKQEPSFDSNLFGLLIGQEQHEIKKMAIQYLEHCNVTLDIRDFANIALTGLLTIDDFNTLLQFYSDQQFVDVILVFIKELDSGKPTHLSKEQIEVLEAGFSKLQEATEAQKIVIIQEIIQKIQTNIDLSDETMNFLEQVIFCFSWENWQQILQNHDFAMNAVDILPEKNMRLLSLLQALRQNIIPRDAEISNVLLYGSTNMVRLLIDIIMHHQQQLLTQSASMLIIFESSVVSLQALAKTLFEAESNENQKRLLMLFIDSPFPHVYEYALKQLEQIYPESIIPVDFMSKLLEHTADKVKQFIADKASFSLASIENESLLLYYIQSVLFSPNRLSRSKQQIYEELPLIAERSSSLKEKINAILFSMTDSNIRLDSDRAFVALAKIKARENSQCK